MAAENKHRLESLGKSNYEIIDGQSDIRGWEVKDSSGKRLGEVDELIFDKEACKVRYLVLDLKNNDYGLENRTVLIPIGLAELHEKEDKVILRNASKEQLGALPLYDYSDINTGIESHIWQVLCSPYTAIAEGAPANTPTTNSNFYAHEHFNNNLYRNRSTRSASDEYIRMRQEPSFLESEGTVHREIDDDIDEMREEKIDLEERDAIPVTNSTSIRSGIDIDERDAADNMPPGTNTDSQQIQRNNDTRNNTSPGI